MLLRPLTLEETVAVSGVGLELVWVNGGEAQTTEVGEYLRWIGGEEVNSNTWMDTDNWQVGSTTPEFENDWGSQFSYDLWMEKMWRKVIDNWVEHNPGGGGGC